MSSLARHVLIVGGGFSGMAAAIELRKRGAEVDIVEIEPGWRNYGAGISLGGATLRAFRQLGILEAFLAEGSATDNVELRLPHGPVVSTLFTPRIAGPDVPGGGAIMRPVLARILADATRAAGVNVRLGCTLTTLSGERDGVDVAFTDGSTGRYDLVIGADGLHSTVRSTIFTGAPEPEYVGQAVWRAVLPKAPEITTVTMWVGPRAKPGVNPVSATEMYLFITEPRPTNAYVAAEDLVPQMRALLADFADPVLQRIAAELRPDSQIVFRPIEKLLMPQPWFRGRVLLIGDTVHATTPHLASGACLGLEDALVLADELQRTDDIDTALRAFQERRWDRCRMVVENSARLADIEISGGDKDEHAHLMRDTLMALAQPV
jgi:2-polyprenyl-6-methoxyphenol hydroxylase-like FAD-dependent oxidoreductase